MKKGSDEARAAMMYARMHRKHRLATPSAHTPQQRHGKHGQHVVHENRQFQKLGIG